MSNATAAVKIEPAVAKPQQSEAEAGNLLAQDSSVRLNRTLAVDQMYWFPRYQAPAGGKGVAIVLDDNSGNLAARLASDFDLVLYLHHSRDYLERARRHVRRAGYDNVEFICSKTAGLPPLRHGVANALFLGRASSVLSEEGGHIRANELLRRLLRCLVHDAVVVMADDNRRDFQKLFGLRGGDQYTGSMRDMVRVLRRAGFASEPFVMRAGYTAFFDPPPDVMRRDCVHDAEPLKQGFVPRFKQRLFGSRTISGNWPSFLLFAQRGAVGESRFQHMLSEEGLRQRCGWADAENVVIKRMIAGNMGVSVVIAGVSGDARRDVVMRLPRSEAGYRSASTNGAALRDLAGSAFSDYAPALLASGTWRGQDYFIEQKLPGREIAFHGARADQMIRQACVAVAGMQAADACAARVDEALFERLIGHHLDELGGFCKGRSSELLARVDAALRRQLIGQRLLVVRKHGDFKLGNILYDEHGQLSALIDWDGSMAEGMPLADYFTLITYRHKEERGYDNFLALNSRVAVDWEVRDFYRGLIDEVAQILRLPAELVPALRCAACLISIQLRLDWTVKSDERWVAEFAEVLLEDMCRLLEGQSGAA